MPPTHSGHTIVCLQGTMEATVVSTEASTIEQHFHTLYNVHTQNNNLAAENE